MTISIDWTNKLVLSTASITDIVAFKDTLRGFEDDDVGMLYDPIIQYKRVDLGGGAYFHDVPFINGYQLKFPNPGNYTVVGNVGAAIVAVAGVYVDRTKSAAFATVSGSGGGSGPTAAEIAIAVRANLAVELARIDTTISGVGGSTLTAADVWAHATRALTVAPSSLTAADVWGYGTRALTVAPSSLTAANVRAELAPELARIDAAISSISIGSGSGATAAEVWAYTNRALTVAPSSITPAQIRTELAPELARIDAAVSSRSTVVPADVWNHTTRALTVAPSSLTAGQVRAELAVELARIDAPISVAYTGTPPTVLNIRDGIRLELASELARIDSTVSSRATNAGVWASPDKAVTNAVISSLTASQIATAVRTELEGELTKIDASISSRMASGDYVKPPSAHDNAVATRVYLTPELAYIDAPISSRATLDAPVDANIVSINGKLLKGEGSTTDPWVPL